jgi:hypothetical protein
VSVGSIMAWRTLGRTLDSGGGYDPHAHGKPGHAHHHRPGHGHHHPTR